MRKIIFVLLILAVAFGVWGYFSGTDNDVKVASVTNLPPDTSAKDAILIDVKSGDVLYEKNANEKAYPASTTKILTGLVALEICQEYAIDLNTQVVIPKGAEGVEGSSLYLRVGEKKSIKELLYGTMLRSGNDGATALAITLGGTLENFVDRMNKTAADLGCVGSNFVNPTGLHDDNHYTTASDLATIASAAMKNKEFREIVGVKSWRSYTNKNKTVFEYDGATGVKIGFTKAAGRTLVASAKREGVELIAVVLSDGNWFNDAYKLLDYGFIVKGIENEQ